MYRIVIFAVAIVLSLGTASAAPLVNTSESYAAMVGTKERFEHITGNAVPRADKNTAEFIGAVLEIDDIGFTECGDRAVVLWLRVTKPVNIPVPLVCAGNSMVNFCLTLKKSQRVRFQGFLSLLPENINEPGFDSCDISTWGEPAPGAFVFIPTKISR